MKRMRLNQLTGAKGLRFVLLWVAVLFFVGCWVWFFWEIWTKDAHPVTLNARALYLSSAVGGVLGTVFALAMGTERTDPDKTNNLRPGATLIGNPGDDKEWTDHLASWAAFAYAAVGIGAIVTWVVRSAQSPPAVEALSSVFAGFLVAALGSALAPGQTTPTRDPGPELGPNPPSPPGPELPQN
jgi:hypothetical protein